MLLLILLLVNNNKFFKKIFFLLLGYIVGLGDRHSNNILIDKKTAELIHIDLGVAFEQGKILQVPELVPFRLTRGFFFNIFLIIIEIDIIDGMGITGYEGVFRRCCEETMKVLRNNYASLITIFEVFLYDPLYQWNLSPPRVLQLQYDDEIDLENNNIMENIIDDNYENATRNIDAEKTLLRLKQKLQGYEYGELLSVFFFLFKYEYRLFSLYRLKDKLINLFMMQLIMKNYVKFFMGKYILLLFILIYKKVGHPGFKKKKITLMN